ncbi:MAG: HAD-IA family hydrolase [Mariprofundaceae bacterium]|nr:HAD-IA family hydrolase [Mariprofundaceae bacterium]
MDVLKTILWDVDGTLADTERDGHRVAFNTAFEKAGLQRRWDELCYGDLLKVTGGKERIRCDIQQGGMPPLSDADIVALHADKTVCYQALIAEGRIPLRPGVRRLLEEVRDAGIIQGVATTTTPAALHALIEHCLGHEWFDIFAVLAAGDIVANKKPAPDVYTYALNQLGADPNATLAMEDSENGTLSAKAAGLRCVVTVNAYTKKQNFSDADLVVSELGDKTNIQVLANPHQLNNLSQVRLHHLQALFDPSIV